jgi:quercetin dioxygenase-like cupin family protein
MVQETRRSLLGGLLGLNLGVPLFAANAFNSSKGNRIMNESGVSALPASGLGPVQRVVTGHDSAGRAVFASEDFAPTEVIPSGDAAFLLMWTTETVPADNNDESDGRNREIGLTLEGGSVVRVVDMLPGKESPMHRTNSIDFGIVIEGEIELELDDGVKKTIRQGGLIVQRGTMHLWRNTTDKVCRIAFVVIQASPYRHNGQPLEERLP